MSPAKITSDAEYLTTTQQKIRAVGLSSELYSRVRAEVESDPRFKSAPPHIRDEIEDALNKRAFSIAKLSSAI